MLRRLEIEQHFNISYYKEQFGMRPWTPTREIQLLKFHRKVGLMAWTLDAASWGRSNTFLLVNASSCISSYAQLSGLEGHTLTLGVFMASLPSAGGWKRQEPGEQRIQEKSAISWVTGVEAWRDVQLNLYWEERPPALGFLWSHFFLSTLCPESQGAHVRVWS